MSVTQPAKMMEAGLSFDELASVIGENVENAGGGIVQRGGQQITIRSVGRVQTLEEGATVRQSGKGIVAREMIDPRLGHDPGLSLAALRPSAAE